MPARRRPLLGFNPKTRALRWIGQPLVVLATLIPLGIAVYGLAAGRIFDPVEALTDITGTSALVILLVSLAVSPLRRLTAWHWLVRFRRTLGLAAFGYALAHLSVYLLLDQGLAWRFIVEDITERPYITVGFTAFLILLPLALTSTNGMMRRLGRNWTRLHRLSYLAAALGVLHFLWLVKADLREPLIYASVLTALLGFRVVDQRLQRRRARKRPGTQPSPEFANS